MRTLVAGCGSMGLPMACALVSKGFDVVGYDIKPSVFQNSPDTLQIVTDPREAQAEALIIVVRDAAQIDALCFDDQALFHHHAPPSRVALCSTVGVDDVLGLRKRLPPEVSLIDAPMSGAPVAAEQTRLSFMLGGDTAEIDTWMPLLAAMGTRHFHLGKLGSGMRVKLLNNTVAASSVVATRHVLAQAKAAGIDTAKLLEILTASSGATWFGDNFHVIDWAPQGWANDNTMGILAKDLAAAMQGRTDADCHLENALTQALQGIESLE